MYFQGDTTYPCILFPGGTQHLSRIVGLSVAKELIFTGRVIDGNEAHQLRLVNHVADQNEAGDAAYQKAMEIAEQIAMNVSNTSRDE